MFKVDIDKKMGEKDKLNKLYTLIEYFKDFNPIFLFLLSDLKELNISLPMAGMFSYQCKIY